MADLFNNQPRSLLPFDGDARYYGAIFSPAEAAGFLNILAAAIPWKNDEVILFGKHIITRRKTAWFGDRPFSYTYSGVARTALPWTRELLTLKKHVEEISETTFNSCLLNLYHDGNEGMSWHSDAEQELEVNAPIASLSLGAERRFLFRHKRTKETIELLLENGSLLIMQGTTQKYWLHSLPVSKKVKTPRVNLTFRTIKTSN